MLFNSYKFLLFFLPPVLFIACRMKGRLLMAWIAACSFVFYAFAGQTWFLIPMAVTIVLDFFVAQRIASSTREGERKLLVALALAVNFGLLFYFKYAAFAVRTVHQLFPNYFAGSVISPVILPAGISFYTFQAVAYIIDVDAGVAPAETNFWRFASFVSFFPHLVAGPLTRHDQLIPGLKNIADNGISPRFEEGIYLFVIGLSKKVLVADRIANVIDPVIANLSTAGALPLGLALLGYTFQLYFDFSGYSDMAIGLGRLFGVELPQNFNSPYRSQNPSDFWTRWHITLSNWFKDYVYGNLMGAARAMGRFANAMLLFNIVITMTLCGLWHGANWTDLCFGAYHGGLLVLYQLTKKSWNALPLPGQRALTFILVCLGFVFFRARSLHQAGDWFLGLAGQRGLGFEQLTPEDAWLAAALVGALALTYAMPPASRYPGFSRLPPMTRAALGVAAGATLLFMNYSSTFLYFQF